MGFFDRLKPRATEAMMRRIILGIGLVLTLAGMAWAELEFYSITGNEGAADQKQEFNRGSLINNRTAVMCDKETSGSIDVAIKLYGQSDYGSNSTIDLTASDRSVVYYIPRIKSINFSSSDAFICEIVRWQE